MDRPTGFAPVRPHGPVPLPGVDALLGAFEALLPSGVASPVPTLVDREVTAAELRRFKLDISFALARDGRSTARFSVNDKGEPEAFRARLRAALPTLDVPLELLDAFLALSRPGAVQTTVSVKWEGGWRIGLYYEELPRDPDGPALIERAFALGVGTPPAPLPGSVPMAVCLDVVDGRVRAGKDYRMIEEHRGDPAPELPPGLGGVRDRLPWHPINGGRRYLVARRSTPAGVTGAKLLWMSEAWIPETAAAAWAMVDALTTELGLPESAPASALRQLRAGWRLDADAFLFPDLVAVNADARGEPEALLVYVSAR